ncbi:hypothetical protein [Fusobacterium necrophorum]|uniref:Uncharacterized protein n=1 Tax=Fusobacterium necrophorum subsp. funduliforme Fnf 1007 TaxID=1161424 RepID=A0AAN3VVZ8_9FUSO|nr:hypothetical protein [Fusobacterium necrophorum]EJU17765.1 hypothetical protein HMPREF1127_2122 [Fusobacterium necrophorum subsp. funduliforme Fnf 1007]KYM45700.1 hypothetical protein A2U15_04665 [Fusobacterium necrophorum subsp. funduliforme]MDK4486143.1 hypothetical protein [Fusobacterium necrophorum]
MWRCKECGGEIVALFGTQKQVISETCELGKDLDEPIILQLECKKCYCHVDNFNQIERIADWVEEEE